jgi:hypothetical protein
MRTRRTKGKVSSARSISKTGSAATTSLIAGPYLKPYNSHWTLGSISMTVFRNKRKGKKKEEKGNVKGRRYQKPRYQFVHKYLDSTLDLDSWEAQAIIQDH